MGRAAAESILHGLVAALAVMAMLSAGRLRAPDTRLRFWLLAVGCSAVLAPLLGLLVPARQSEAFRDQWALFSGDRLSLLVWHGISAGPACALLLALVGFLVYLRDLVPFLLDIGRGQKWACDTTTVPAGLSASVAKAAAACAMPIPRLRVLATRHPVLVCRGLRRPIIVASTGLLNILSKGELDAAIAHEIAHAKLHDPALGWVLMLVRGIFCFNPSVQLCARAAAHEIERRADESAARAASSRESGARSLRKLADASRYAARAPHLRAWHGFRLAAIEQRCQSLQGTHPSDPAPRWTLAAATVGLALVLFFTVA